MTEAQARAIEALQKTLIFCEQEGIHLTLRNRQIPEMEITIEMGEMDKDTMNFWVKE